MPKKNWNLFTYLQWVGEEMHPNQGGSWRKKTRLIKLLRGVVDYQPEAGHYYKDISAFFEEREEEGDGGALSLYHWILYQKEVGLGRGVHARGKLSKNLCATFIVLIPKVEGPGQLKDFRPISLIGSI